MSAIDTLPAVPKLEALQAPVHIGEVVLRVADLDRVAGFYEKAIGLAPLSRQLGEVVLGVDDVPLVTLRGGARERTTPAGLFHTAFLLPSRRDLADWLAHAARSGVQLEGASDHLVSEALYLSDPEGNGIEIYRDRPREDWPRRDGRIAMATERLDLQALLREGSDRFAGLGGGSRIGHIHLSVADTVATEAFYDELGFETMVHYPGASFMATGGYHHHIAGNVWHSRNAAPRSEGEAGLDAFTLTARGAEDRERLAALMGGLGAAATEKGPALADPSGNRVVLAA